MTRRNSVRVGGRAIARHAVTAATTTTAPKNTHDTADTAARSPADPGSCRGWLSRSVWGACGPFGAHAVRPERTAGAPNPRWHRGGRMLRLALGAGQASASKPMA